MYDVYVCGCVCVVYEFSHSITIYHIHCCVCVCFFFVFALYFFSFVQFFKNYITPPLLTIIIDYFARRVLSLWLIFCIFLSFGRSGHRQQQIVIRVFVMVRAARNEQKEGEKRRTRAIKPVHRQRQRRRQPRRRRQQQATTTTTNTTSQSRRVCYLLRERERARANERESHHDNRTKRVSGNVRERARVCVSAVS